MMKKLFIFVICCMLCSLSALAKTDYSVLYENAQVADFEFMHGVDPFQIEEYYKYAWAPYPLLRTSSTLYFKNLTIPPGYYLLTQRKYKGEDWILFKEAGKVKFIIPVVETQFVAEDFYKTKIPIQKKTKWQTFCKNISDFMYKSVFRKSQKVPPPNAYIQSMQVEGNFFLIILYFGNTAYYTIFKNSK